MMSCICLCRIAEDEIEFGLGIHGEPGAFKQPMEPNNTLIPKVSPAHPPLVLTELTPLANAKHNIYAFLAFWPSGGVRLAQNFQ